MKQARRSVQGLLGSAHDHEIIFNPAGARPITPNSFLRSRRRSAATKSSPPSSIPPSMRWSTNLATTTVKTHVIPLHSYGRLDIGAFRCALVPRTAIASVM